MTMVRYGKEIENDFVSVADLYKKAIIYEKDDIGKLSIRGTESLRHYLAKAVLVYNLKRMGHKVVCEVQIAGIGYLDVYDIDTKVIYEIETQQSAKTAMRYKKKYQQAGVDIVIIQIRSWNDDMGGLNEYIKMWIRPD